MLLCRTRHAKCLFMPFVSKTNFFRHACDPEMPGHALRVYKEMHMRLYFAPMTCSLSLHIVLRELGLPYELIRVKSENNMTAVGSDSRYQPEGICAALCWIPVKCLRKVRRSSFIRLIFRT